MDWTILGFGLWLLGQSLAISPNGARFYPWAWCVVGALIVILTATPVV